jgi:hypothetical protein
MKTFVEFLREDKTSAGNGADNPGIVPKSHNKPTPNALEGRSLAGQCVGPTVLKLNGASPSVLA